MSERERSRSPDPADQSGAHNSDDRGHENGHDGAGGGDDQGGDADGIKLYVGNLDYGT